jgi:F420-dependent oxidoreductase-like protein
MEAGEMTTEVTGLSIGGGRSTNDDEIIAVTRRADELGYDTVWTGEAWGRDVFTVLTMIACHTGRLRLGTGIATVFSRTPSMIAQSIASLDVISKGRAVLGLGTSGRLVVEGWHGLKYERPLERTREYIEIIRMALAGQRVNYQGRNFQLSRFRLQISPVQERIPIFVASLGQRNMALTGEMADGWLPTWVHVDHLPGMKAQLEEGAAKAGRNTGDLTAAPQILSYVTRNADDKVEARRLLSGHMAYYVGGMGTYYNELFQRYGYGEEAQRVREAWALNERERAASMFSDDILDKLTIWGDVEECRDKLERYRANGADMPVIGFPHGCPLDASIRTLEALAPRG